MTIELINHKDPGYLKKGMDIKLTSNNDISTIEDENELIQDVQKCVVTEKQIDGYGTNINSIRGMKNKDLFKALGILSILESLQYLKDMHNVAYSNNKINNDAVLKSVKKVNVSSNQQTINYSVELITGQEASGVI